MTSEIRRDIRRLMHLRAAITRAQGAAEEIRGRIQRRREAALTALLRAILDAPDDAARAEAIEHARQVLDGDTPCPR